MRPNRNRPGPRLGSASATPCKLEDESPDLAGTVHRCAEAGSSFDSVNFSDLRVGRWDQKPILYLRDCIRKLRIILEFVPHRMLAKVAPMLLVGLGILG